MKQLSMKRLDFYLNQGPKSLSKKIIRATMDETSLKKIGIEGEKHYKEFNVEKMCFSTYSEYKNY